MRPGQQNRRMRGRGGGGGNNPNRKGPNPLTRNYESNGPDVKIRGSAQQIAEKYGNLARDAQSAGDRVMAENYLQHAEHYNRIIMAAQAQFASQQPVRDQREDFEDESEDEREELEQAAAPAATAEAPKQQPITGAEPQPVIEGMPAEVALEEETLQRKRQERRANGNGGEHEEQAAPRRARRPRRSRSRADQQNEGDAGEGAEAGAERAEANGEIIVPAAAES